MGVRFISMSGATLIAGRFARTIGRSRAYLASLMLLGAAILMTSFFSSFEIQTLLFLLSGVAFGILMPLLPVTVAESVDPAVRGTAIGIYRTFFDGGAIVAPILLTWIATIWGITYCFYFSAILLFLNGLAFLSFRACRSTFRLT